MILLKSFPDGAKVFLDGKMVSATNTTLSGLKPGYHEIRLEKAGFSHWRKNVDVQAELVTELSAILVPLSPKLIPLTTNGARSPSISNDGTRLAFFSKDEGTPGVWFLDLDNQNILNFTKPNPKLLISDQPINSFSEGSLIQWSPEDTEILLKTADDQNFLLKTAETPVRDFVATSSPEPTNKTWEEKKTKSKLLLINKSKITEEIKKLIVNPETIISPDGNKILYSIMKGKIKEYHVIDLTDPLPIGGKPDYVTLSTIETERSAVSWFSDSRNLLVFSCDNQAKPSNPKINSCPSASIEIIEIDGDNRNLVFKGNVSEKAVFPSPNGRELIILTNFNPDSEPNLYAISLR